MARNRRNQSGAVRFVPVVKTIVICMLIGGSAVGYVLQKNKLYDLGRQITKREISLDRLKMENSLLASQLADMQSPPKLAERVKQQKMGLFPTQPGQTIWLPEPTAAKPLPDTVPLVAVQNPGAGR